MAINSRQKGKRGELEFCKLCKKHGYDVHRTAQYCGNTGQAADVVGLDGIHAEVKNTETLRLREYMYQAIHDAKKEGKGNLPVVFYHKGRDRWYAIMDVDDWFELYGRAEGRIRIV